MSNKKENNLLGKQIKTNREKLNLTQQELAENSFLTVNNIAKIERSENLPNAQTLINLSIALETDPNEYIADYKAQSAAFANNN